MFGFVPNYCIFVEINLKLKIMKKLGLAIILFYVYFVGSWIGNLVILLNCNFDEPWRDEIIHGIGLVPFVSMITVWM